MLYYFNLKEDLKSYYRDLLPEKTVRKLMDEPSIFKMVSSAHGIIMRIPYPMKRKVYYSDFLASSPLLEKYRSAISDIANRFEKGQDVSPYLSNTIYVPNFPDYALNNRGLHHFHLGKMKDNSVARSPHILFAKINDSEAYFVAITEHDKNNGYPEFWDEKLAQIIRKNWPEQTITLNGISSGNLLTLEQRKTMEKKGAFSPMTDDNQLYMIGMGQTTSGTSVASTMYACRFINLVYKYKKYIVNNVHIYLPRPLSPPMGINISFVGFKDDRIFFGISRIPYGDEKKLLAFDF